MRNERDYFNLTLNKDLLPKIKEAKKKKKAEDEEKTRINNTIRKAQGLPKALTPQDAGYFNNCFG